MADLSNKIRDALRADDEEALARRFAERGIAVAAADHRMSKALWMDAKLDKGIEHPVHVQDCAAAFAWLVRNAAGRSQPGQWGRFHHLRLHVHDGPGDGDDAPDGLLGRLGLSGGRCRHVGCFLRGC